MRASLAKSFTPIVAAALVLTGLPALANDNSESWKLKVSGFGQPGSTITLTGENLDQVQAVEIDSLLANFSIVSDDTIQVQIPVTVQPGDATLRLRGEFGSVAFSSLFEVTPQSRHTQPKVTIGTFQGFIAVYTKNFKGFSMRIKIGDRERVISLLESNFTKNLTRVGSGEVQDVSVYINESLVRSERVNVR